MTYPFLSDEWMDAAKAIYDKYAGQSSVTPPKVQINQVITDVPFGEGEIKMHVDSTGGELRMERGELAGAPTTITIDYATAKAIFVNQDAAAGMQAFMSGKIKVQGDITAIMSMQSAPQDDVTKKIADEIKDITEI